MSYQRPFLSIVLLFTLLLSTFATTAGVSAFQNCVQICAGSLSETDTTITPTNFQKVPTYLQIYLNPSAVPDDTYVTIAIYGQLVWLSWEAHFGGTSEVPAEIPLDGRSVSLSCSGNLIGVATTSLGGYYSYNWTNANLASGSYVITAFFQGDSMYASSSISAVLTARLWAELSILKDSIQYSGDAFWIRNVGNAELRDISISASDEVASSIELDTYFIPSLPANEMRLIHVRLIPPTSDVISRLIKNYEGVITVKSVNGGSAEVHVEIVWETTRTPHFILYHRADSGTRQYIEGFLKTAVDNIYGKIGNALGIPFQDETTMYVFQGKEEFASLLGMTPGEKAVGGFYDPSSDCIFTYSGHNVVTIAHEFTHRIVRKYTFPWRVPPRWLDEGIADYGAYLAVNKEFIGTLKDEIRAFNQSPVRFEEVRNNWQGTMAHRGAAFSFIMFIGETYGDQSVRRILEGLRLNLLFIVFGTVDDVWIFRGVLSNAVHNGEGFNNLEDEWHNNHEELLLGLQ